MGPQASSITSVESSCSTRLLRIPPLTDQRSSAMFSERREFTAVSRSILDFKLSEEQMVRLQLKVLMDSARDALNTMLLDADLPNGEPSSRLTQQADAQLILLLLRPLTLSPDMDLSANKMVSLQLSSLKFFKMVITISKFAPRFLRKSSLLLCNNF